MNTLGGYGTFETDDDGVATTDTAAESFILDALSKVYKINNVCGPDKLSSCGIPSKITTLGAEAELNFPTKMSELNSKLLNGLHVENEDGDVVDTKAAAFETVNGESIAVFYNPNCGSSTSKNHFTQNKMCANFVYDLNGAEGPNEVGRDVGFITAFYNKNSVVVAPIPYGKDYETKVSHYIENTESIDAGSVCKTMSEDLRLPNQDEIGSLFVNSHLLNLDKDTGYYWSSSVISSGLIGQAWRQDFIYGGRNKAARSTMHAIRCIKK